MAEFIINTKYEDEIRKIINETKSTHIGVVLKSKKKCYLYQYLQSKYPQIVHDTVTEYVYWFVNGLVEYPKCKVCGKDVHIFYSFEKGYSETCCHDCANHNPNRIEKIKNTCMEHYGVDVPMKSKIVLEKSKLTNLKRHGVENGFQSKEAQEKYKRTCKEKFGSEWALQNKDIIKKRTDTLIENYGVDVPSKSEVIREKIKETCLERFGEITNLKCQDTKDKIKQTCIERYGVDHISRVVEIRKRTEETCLKRFGVKSPCQNLEIFNKVKKTCLERYGCETPSAKYLYNNVSFDSAPELVYFIWLTDHNIKFEYHPDRYFLYIDNGNKHRYYPDFYLMDEIRFVEVKGSHFFYQGEGIMVNPYSGKSEQSKYNCMIENKVEILLETSDKIKECFNYVRENYGLNYIKQFKLNRKHSNS